MAPSLPSSLSPHICILSSPDLEEVFESSGLPPLPQILQSFAPLPQVTTRTISLTPVPHSSFALRFSDLVEIETATHEDDEQRAARTMDWMAARIAGRCSRWVDLMESQAASSKDSVWRDRTPWWEEVKRCVEGDHVPNSMEGWNHPVAVIIAVSTNAVNPLQALQDLHARAIDFPPWVDGTHLRYSLIVHPANSPLADPIAEALYNAVKKQYGLHSYLLPLALPTSPLPAPVPIPPPIPRLPTPSAYETPPLAPYTPLSGLTAPATPTLTMSPMPRSPRPSNLMADQRQPTPTPNTANASTLRLSERDIQQTGKFVREFVVMSLVPWMERCVVEWNETYSSSRRLPSRLFSSTRRLFGSSAPASPAPPTPNHGSNSSVSSMSSRFTHGPNNSVSSITSTSSFGTIIGGTVTQQRRLAEFATMLGDHKLAVTVWEALRKDSKGGSDVLPILLAPSPALALHASNALTALQSQPQLSSEAPALVQLRGLVYAVRWDISVDKVDFVGPVLEGERWLVQAAGSADEPPAALLLAHAAFLSERKGRRRRSALWYLSAADRLEKAGIKPLAMHFFRKAHHLYKTPPAAQISPSFWESEDKDPKDWRGFDDVLPGIEHELGRLMYTTGNTEGAVRYFLGLLRWCSLHPQLPSHSANGTASSEVKPVTTDKVYLEDFRVATKHFKTTERDQWEAAALQLPITFCQVKQTRVRFPGDAIEGDATEWDKKEEEWSAFWAPRGKEKLEKSGKAAVDETFWVDLVLHNSLNVEVTLSGLSVVVREKSAGDADPNDDLVNIEVVDDIVLEAKDTRTIPVSVKCRRPASLVITHAVYNFLDLLPATESLAIRGRRLHDTPLQRQTKAYAPDVPIQIEVEEAGQRLHVNFVDDRHLILGQGEYKHLKLSLTNSGTRSIRELWMLTGKDDEIWIDIQVPNGSDPSTSSPSFTEILHSSNSLAPRRPYCVSLEQIHKSSVLGPGENMQIPAVLHASHVAEQDLCILFIFREAEGAAFHCSRVIRHYEVRPVIHASASSRPSQSPDRSFVLNLEVENLTASNDIRLTQVTTMSGMWSCSPLSTQSVGPIPPHQVARLTLGATRWQGGSGSDPTIDFVSQKLRDVLSGNSPDTSEPPPIDLVCGHVSEDFTIRSVNVPSTRHFIRSCKRSQTAHLVASSHPYVPADSHHLIFPLHNPYSVDILVFWELPAQGRSGHVLISGITLGARHGALKEIVEEADSAKVKRSMYAETRRQRSEILRSIRDSEWNAEMNPVVVTVQDGRRVDHDFSKGPRHVSVAFTLRNLSLTHPSRIVLKLQSASAEPASSAALLPPQYAGRLTYRSTLAPSASHIFQVKLWVTRPGSYALDGWTVETDVGERANAGTSTGVWRTRHRYVQGPLADYRHSVTVVDVTPS
ncbi:hypothetical protein SCP_0111240 [Sparassis crispa]|uniref:TPPC8 first Ig-like domain-containing protein n=1 Tax=Sparassis crispa TaxID=139825 RepID=A0A401G7U7_9APHY|nr:hypothetical protein SCP_0111240 [Sparassis crispa]GBE78241.1 hypothetical protein SCP_0111240 [Sparassis crispa]